MDTYSVRQGVALPIAVQINDDQGNPITSYTGSEVLTASLWPGGNLPPVATPTCTWVSGPAGTIAILISATQTAALLEGRYQGTVDLVDPAKGSLEAYTWAVDVLQASGTGVTPPVYSSFTDMLRYGRGWLRKLQTEDDQAGYLQENAEARSWLDEFIIARYPTNYYALLGDAGYGSLAWGSTTGALPNQWLRDRLAAGGLVQRPWVSQACARKALAIVARSQIGMAESGTDYRLLARISESEASGIALSHTAEICTDGSGVPSFGIALGYTSMRPTC